MRDHREHQRRFRAAHPERARETDRRAGAKWNAANPEKRQAHTTVQAAIKYGVLARPVTCEECGKDCQPEAAHHDYSKPLDVRWLCRQCHVDYDRR